MNNIKEKLIDLVVIFGIFIFLFAVMNLTSGDNFSEWDENDNNKISQSEFQEQFIDEYFTEWNADDNEYLDAEEFHQGIFDLVDADDSETINTEEREWGFEHLYGDYVNYEVTVQDDGDETIVDYDSYRNAVHDSNYYSDADADGNNKLTREEMTQTVFNSWDMNNDGYLDKAEFDTFNSHYSNV